MPFYQRTSDARIETWCKQWQNTITNFNARFVRATASRPFLQFLYKYHTQVKRSNQYTFFFCLLLTHFLLRFCPLKSIYWTARVTLFNDTKKIRFMFVQLTCLLEYDNLMWTAWRGKLKSICFRGVSFLKWNGVTVCQDMWDQHWRRPSTICRHIFLLFRIIKSYIILMALRGAHIMNNFNSLMYQSQTIYYVMHIAHSHPNCIRAHQTNNGGKFICKS